MWKIVRSKLRPTRLFHSKIVDASNALDSFFVSQLYIGQCHIYVVIVARVCGAIGIIILTLLICMELPCRPVVVNVPI